VSTEKGMQSEVDLDSLESGNEEFLDIFVISTSSIGFQVWKAIMIIASFVSSFDYAQMAAFSSATNNEVS